MRAARLSPLLVLLLSAPAARAQAFDTLRTDDGVRLVYRVAGRAGGPPVVFLHGGPGYNSHSFAVQAGPGLERSARMVYLDQRGCGRSERPASGAYTMDRLVADVEALRVRLGAAQIVPLGHSFGGALALEYAARHPERTAGVVLVAPLSDAPGSMASWRDALRAWHPALAAGADTTGDWDGAIGAAGGQAFFNRMQFVDEALLARQDRLDAASGLANTGELSSALWAGGLGSYRFAAFDRLTMPVLLVSGGEDRAIGPATTEALGEALPYGDHRRYEAAGHFPYLDAPARFAADVAAFLDRLR